MQAVKNKKIVEKVAEERKKIIVKVKKAQREWAVNLERRFGSLASAARKAEICRVILSEYKMGRSEARLSKIVEIENTIAYNTGDMEIQGCFIKLLRKAFNQRGQTT